MGEMGVWDLGIWSVGCWLLPRSRGLALVVLGGVGGVGGSQPFLLRSQRQLRELRAQGLDVPRLQRGERLVGDRLVVLGALGGGEGERRVVEADDEAHGARHRLPVLRPVTPPSQRNQQVLAGPSSHD